MKQKIVIVNMVVEDPVGDFFAVPVEEFTPEIRAHLELSSNHDSMDDEEFDIIFKTWRQKYNLKVNYIVI